MRPLLLIAAVLLLASCSKESAETKNQLLKNITVNGAISQSFEYDPAGKLVKENYYSFCTTPTDEFTHTYKSDNMLLKTASVIRSLYSSSAALCDPASGIHSADLFEYDDRQRVKKIIRENSITTYTYNNRGLIEKAEHSNGTAIGFSTYQYDSNNNLVEEYGSQGTNTTRYEFDSRINPLYNIKSRPGIITAFNASPNNVVKIISGSSTQSIRYEYDAAGFPVKMFDPNGSTYLYHY